MTLRMRRAIFVLLILACGCRRRGGDAYKMEEVAAAGARACAAMRDGSVRCWGRQDGARVTTPTTIPAVAHATRVCTGNAFACALDKEGHVACWADNATPRPVALGVNASALGCGEEHACALVQGNVLCWGSGARGELGDGSRSDHPNPVAVADAAGATAIALGGHTSCAVFADGGAKCWGRGDEGQLGDGTFDDHAIPTLVRATSIHSMTVGRAHTCFVRQDETVACFGSNDDGQLGDGTRERRATPVNAVGLLIARDVAAGAHHTCARLGDSTVRCWGKNDVHQAGLTSDPDILVPTAISGLYESVGIATGDDFSCVRMQDGWLRCFGVNDWGQLADGTTDVRNVPTPIHFR
jgi:alpha-tubulin suppressor-like RCC1 family protein